MPVNLSLDPILHFSFEMDTKKYFYFFFFLEIFLLFETPLCCTEAVLWFTLLCIAKSYLPTMVQYICSWSKMSLKVLKASRIFSWEQSIASCSPSLYTLFPCHIARPYPFLTFLLDVAVWLSSSQWNLSLSEHKWSEDGLEVLTLKKNLSHTINLTQIDDDSFGSQSVDDGVVGGRNLGPWITIWGKDVHQSGTPILCFIWEKSKLLPYLSLYIIWGLFVAVASVKANNTMCSTEYNGKEQSYFKVPNSFRMSFSQMSVLKRRQRLHLLWDSSSLSEKKKRERILD